MGRSCALATACKCGCAHAPMHTSTCSRTEAAAPRCSCIPSPAITPRRWQWVVRRPSFPGPTHSCRSMPGPAARGSSRSPPRPQSRTSPGCCCGWRGTAPISPASFRRCGYRIRVHSRWRSATSAPSHWKASGWSFRATPPAPHRATSLRCSAPASRPRPARVRTAPRSTPKPSSRYSRTSRTSRSAKATRSCSATATRSRAC